MKEDGTEETEDVQLPDTEADRKSPSASSTSSNTSNNKVSTSRNASNNKVITSSNTSNSKVSTSGNTSNNKVITNFHKIYRSIGQYFYQRTFIYDFTITCDIREIILSFIMILYIYIVHIYCSRRLHVSVNHRVELRDRLCQENRELLRLQCRAAALTT